MDWGLSKVLDPLRPLIRNAAKDKTGRDMPTYLQQVVKSRLSSFNLTPAKPKGQSINLQFAAKPMKNFKFCTTRICCLRQSICSHYPENKNTVTTAKTIPPDLYRSTNALELTRNITACEKPNPIPLAWAVLPMFAVGGASCLAYNLDT